VKTSVTKLAPGWVATGVIGHVKIAVQNKISDKQPTGQTEKL